MPRLLTSALLGFCLVASELIGADASIPPVEKVLDGLRAKHPRLMATADDFDRLNQLCKIDKTAHEWLSRLTADAEKLLSAKPVEYEIPDGKRLLAVSRAAKDRVLLLGLIYRLTADQRFADRLWQELDTVTQFKDWNPSHFLDTAEMTFAVAIGYDWLYDTWTEAQRKQLAGAIVRLGLEQGLPIYRQQSWWSRATHNWNQVCNGGMTVGALAIADQEPALAREIVHAAVTSLPRAMHEFAPDGGWGEGPGYWRYATEYNVYLLAALNTALCHDFGLSTITGFSETGDFPIHFTGPTGETFNYADAHSGWRGAPQLFWLATTFDRPAWAAAQKNSASDRASPLDLLWGAAWLSDNARHVALPLDRHFEGVSVAFLRGAWNDAQATFVGFKGGDNRVNHGQLDLGSFVLDALGERWILDLGPDNYNLPGYFGAGRWNYYRNRAEGHNTLVLNPSAAADQDPQAKAKIVEFQSQMDRAWAVADLSAAYASSADRVCRGVALINRRDVLVQDEIVPNNFCDVWWFAHTSTAVSLDPACRTASFSQNGKAFYATIVEPPQAAFQVLAAVPMPSSPLPAGQADANHSGHAVRKLAIHLSGKDKMRIAVLLSPAKGAKAPDFPLGQSIDRPRD